MNQIPRRDRYAEEIARIREIVGRHPFPSYVTSFDVSVGEFDGDPAMWITFKLKSAPEPEGAALAERTHALARLRQSVGRDLLDSFEERYPYFRFESDEISRL